MPLPLSGVRIVEMGQLIAIPHAIKLLGDMGAQVIRIESCARLDNYRTSSIYANSIEGRHWDRAANFYEQNRNKYSLTLELNDDDCIDALRELISISDVFAENFTPRVMRNFNLEYDDLRQIKPDIIMVSSTGYGYTGPWADYGAIGFTTEATSGLSHISGYKNEAPVLPEIPYADYTAAEHTAFAIMAALAYRARTGKGQFIDVSQSETLTSTIPEAILDYSVNGRTAERIGNQDTLMSPHGCYPCVGIDKWIAIAVSTDAEWRALCDVLQRPDWLANDRFANSMSRWQHRNALDELIAGETAQHERNTLMNALQSRGVPAGAVLDGKGLLFDPHLKERGFYEVARHEPITEMPPLPYTSRPWKFSKTPAVHRTAAPTLGRDNRFVLRDIIGASPSHIDAMENRGAIGTAPPNPRPPRIASTAEQLRRGQIFAHDPNHRQNLARHYPV
ncbi:MAG: CoA transferase [Chloroflexi bacterium]|nr:CoA transferase [Chloroflexota bacterium]